MYVLGIDAGGTKTVCLLADDQGTILDEARGGGANLQAHGELEVEKVLHHVMEAAIGDRDLRPTAICLGIAGVDRAHGTRDGAPETGSALGSHSRNLLSRSQAGCDCRSRAGRGACSLRWRRR